MFQGLAKFYSTLYTSFLRHIPYSNPTLRAIVIASPGWVRDAVFDYIMSEASKTNNKALLAARNKFLRVHVNSPHVHSLVEVLKSLMYLSKSKNLSFREKRMLDRARFLVISEISEVTEQPMDVVEQRVDEALGTCFKTKDSAEVVAPRRATSAAAAKASTVKVTTATRASARRAMQAN